MAYLDVNIDVDIDVDDFLEACSDFEIKEVLEWLSNNDYDLKEENETNKDLLKLLDVFVLTAEDELTIKNIAKKYP